MNIKWIDLDIGAHIYLQTPIIYFNPANKKVFFNRPYGFSHGDYIQIHISRDKKFLKFSLNEQCSSAYTFSEFENKEKGSISCGLLFNEFPELFQRANKYQSQIDTESGFEYSLIVNLENPMEIKRKLKKDHKEVEQLALSLIDQKENNICIQ